MADSELTASELRQRYHRGGTVPDDQLNAQQLRARHGITHNSRDFSTADKNSGSVMNPAIIGVIVVIVIILIGGAVVLSGKDQ